VPNIIESFEWMAPQWKVVDAGKNTIRIKGVALKGDATSKNNRKYIADELRKSARTWVGKPITINHDPKRIAGNLTWMEYSEESDALEYLGDVNKQPYVDMLRNKSAQIRGVSIEAEYLHNQCPRCGMRFYSDEEFHDHMHNVEFIKTDPTKEPHGIIGTALSLVLSPEEPGYSGTTVQVLETVQNSVGRLFETLAKVEEEKERMSQTKTYGLEKKTTVTAPTIKTMTPEQKVELEKLTTVTEPPTKVEANTPTQTAQKEPVITEPKVAEAKPEVPNLQKPMERTRVQLTIVPTTLKEVKPPEPSPTTKEKLTLGEPFAGYTDFADCVAKNQEKDNPEAYCGSIKHEVEGEMVYRKGVAERLTEMGHAMVLVNTNAKEIQMQGFKSAESVAEQTNKALDEVYILMDGYTKKVSAIQESHKSAMEVTAKKVDMEPIVKDLAENKITLDKKADMDVTTKRFAEIDATISKKVDAEPLAKKVTEIEAILTKKADAESINKELAETKALISKKADAEPLNKELTETKTALAKTTENLAKLEEKFIAEKKTEEQIREAREIVDAQNKQTFEEWKKHSEAIEAKLKTAEAKLQESEAKKVKETAELEVRIDNVEDKQKGAFKGRNKELKHEEPVRGDPMKGAN